MGGAFRWHTQLLGLVFDIRVENTVESDWVMDLIMCCIDVSESQDVTTEEQQMEVETGAAASSSVQLGNIPEVKDIVESSDC